MGVIGPAQRQSKIEISAKLIEKMNVPAVMQITAIRKAWLLRLVTSVDSTKRTTAWSS